MRTNTPLMRHADILSDKHSTQQNFLNESSGNQRDNQSQGSKVIDDIPTNQQISKLCTTGGKIT